MNWVMNAGQQQQHNDSDDDDDYSNTNNKIYILSNSYSHGTISERIT